jgi:hypothetical protein
MQLFHLQSVSTSKCGYAQLCGSTGIAVLCCRAFQSCVRRTCAAWRQYMLRCMDSLLYAPAVGGYCALFVMVSALSCCMCASAWHCLYTRTSGLLPALSCDIRVVPMLWTCPRVAVHSVSISTRSCVAAPFASTVLPSMQRRAACESYAHFALSHSRFV